MRRRARSTHHKRAHPSRSVAADVLPPTYRIETVPSSEAELCQATATFRNVVFRRTFERREPAGAVALVLGDLLHESRPGGGGVRRTAGASVRRRWPAALGVQGVSGDVLEPRDGPLNRFDARMPASAQARCKGDPTQQCRSGPVATIDQRMTRPTPDHPRPTPKQHGVWPPQRAVQQRARYNAEAWWSESEAGRETLHTALSAAPRARLRRRRQPARPGRRR